MKIRSSSLCYARQKKNKMSSKENYLEEKITYLQKRLDEANVSAMEKQQITEEISIINSQRDEISEYKTKGAIIRSRARWYNDGEKNTKYFLNLEKRHLKQKTIKCLHLSDNEVVNTDEEILKEAKSFYQKLYSSTVSSTVNQCDEIFFPLGNIETLTEREQNECGCLLTEAECWESLKSMQPNKSPGTDGLSPEFYKVFWKDISFHLLNALNHAYIKGCLSITQRRGIITLIPKKHKPVNKLKNWRPITLLNYDYKIASKCIANRIQKILPKLINNDQTGFLKGRFIGENIRLIDSIIHYANTKQIPGLLLFIDFEKAFDSIEWAFIEKTLNYYNFGSSLVAWFRLFYSDISSCVQNNGWASDFFPLSRGVRQGCPLSSYLFLLCAEILGSAIRNDNLIRGFKVLDTESKISQYADDTTLILDGSESSFFRSLSILDSFALISGLKVNYEKTEALLIGPYKSSETAISSSKPIRWAKDKVYALGIWLSTSNDAYLNTNSTEKINKLQSILNNWSAKRLTLLGKITILKSLAISQMVYLLSSLPTSQKILQDVNTILYDFLWGGKGDKIKRTEMINNYNKGGLKMIDIRNFNTSLKVKWLQGYLDSDNKGKWKVFFDYHLERYGGKLLILGNLKQRDAKQLVIQDPFVKEVIECWSTINYREKNLKFESAFIWHNSLITIEKKPIFYQSWSNAGVQKVVDLLNKDGSFFSFDEFLKKFKIKTNYLEYFKVISALRQYKNMCLSIDDSAASKAVLGFRLPDTNTCRKVYQGLTERKATLPFKSQNKWMKGIVMAETTTVNWEKTYLLAFKCTKETKLREFQFKLLHRRIATNDYLYKIGLKQSDLCTFCGEETENLTHLFLRCKYSKSFWEEFSQWLAQNTSNMEGFAPSEAILLGIVSESKNLLLHHLILLARHHIYICKLKETRPSIEMYKQLVHNTLQIENKIAIVNNSMHVFKKKWSCFKNINFQSINID